MRIHGTNVHATVQTASRTTTSNPPPSGIPLVTRSVNVIIMVETTTAPTTASHRHADRMPARGTSQMRR
nr:hypothetical protein [Cellulomonas sp. HZM]